MPRDDDPCDLRIEVLRPGLSRLTLVYESLPGQTPCAAHGAKAELAIARWCGESFANYIHAQAPALAAAIMALAQHIPSEPADTASFN